ncbi:MAG: phosphoribosylaminoimidazolesuccinocarboxamide synthase, partial [Firmicutes bacterium]|nr:phosphoribosylaminoimidazolesuccinocarboxamide synthase [Bacillota bacterium]
MEKIYTGKTKDVYKKQEGILVFHFKDDVTGADGVVDRGANSVLGQISGKGKMSLELTRHYFKLLESNNIPTHFISADISRGNMEVKNAQL